MRALTKYTATLMKGRGASDQRVSSGSMRTMTPTVSTIMVTKVKPYITAGPRYMRTLDTSSEMRFIRSPVAFTL